MVDIHRGSHARSRGALRDFYEGEGRRGEQLCDPPILAGKRVVPLVIADLPKKGNPRR
jgi:hypothetical protein